MHRVLPALPTWRLWASPQVQSITDGYPSTVHTQPRSPSSVVSTRSRSAARRSFSSSSAGSGVVVMAPPVVVVIWEWSCHALRPANREGRGPVSVSGVVRADQVEHLGRGHGLV